MPLLADHPPTPATEFFWHPEPGAHPTESTADYRSKKVKAYNQTLLLSADLAGDLFTDYLLI